MAENVWRSPHYTLITDAQGHTIHEFEGVVPEMEAFKWIADNAGKEWRCEIFRNFHTAPGRTYVLALKKGTDIRETYFITQEHER